MTATHRAADHVARHHLRVCHLCDGMCGVVITTQGDQVTGVRGDPDDPFSRGHLCPKAAALADLHHDPDRLRAPLKRTAAGWQAIGWEQAYDEIGARIRALRREFGPRAVASYYGNPTAHDLGLMTFGMMLARAAGTRFSANSVDSLPHLLASWLVFGHQGLLPVPDLDRTTHFLALGGNPLVSNGSFMSSGDVRARLRGIQRRGGRIVVLDPRRTETAQAADAHHFVRPGSDALLLLALVHTLFETGATRLGHLAARIDGVDALRSAASRFTPERVADAVGLSATTIRSLAQEFARAPAAVCYGRLGVSTQAFGGLCAWLLIAVNALTGNLDRAGGAMFTTPAADLVALGDRLGARGSYATFRSAVRGLPEFNGELPVSTLAEEIGAGHVRALITIAGNPALSAPDSRAVDRALERLDLMVSLDPYLNETTRHAHYILPGASSLTRPHYDLALSLVAVRNVARWSPAVFERPDAERHDWENALALWSRIGVPAPLGPLVRRALAGGPERLVDLLLRLGPARTGVARLAADHPHGRDLGPLQPRLLAALGRRRIDLAPRPYLDDLGRLEAVLTAPVPELVLIGRRHLRCNNSWMHNSERLVKGKARCTLMMHPADADARGVGDHAVVRSPVGEVTVPVERTTDLMPGVVSLPHGWGHDRAGARLGVAAAHAGVSANDVIEARVDPVSGIACLSGQVVTVHPA